MKAERDSDEQGRDGKENRPGRQGVGRPAWRDPLLLQQRVGTDQRRRNTRRAAIDAIRLSTAPKMTK